MNNQKAIHWLREAMVSVTSSCDEARATLICDAIEYAVDVIENRAAMDAHAKRMQTLAARAAGRIDELSKKINTARSTFDEASRELGDYQCELNGDDVMADLEKILGMKP